MSPFDLYYGTPEERALQAAIEKRAHEAEQKHAIILEQTLRLHLQAKPQWFPAWLWRRIVRRVVRIELSPLTARLEDSPHA